MHQKRGEILKGFKGPSFFCSAKMPLLITTKLKDGGEVIWHFFFRLGLAGLSTFCLTLGWYGYVRTHMLIVYYAIPWLWFPLLSRKYTFVDLNKKRF